jgi:hypothetical protein
MKQINSFYDGYVSSPLNCLALFLIALFIMQTSRLSAQAFNDPAQEKIGEMARSFYQRNIAGPKAGGLEKTTAINEHFLTGAAAGDYFGYSISSAGDVNGDGYGDVIVGAPYNDASGSNAGRAYIYFGGLSMHTTPDVILTGAAASDYFGRSVSSAGDVNGDGYGDVIVGAYRNDASGTDAGGAYIYFGGASTDNTPDVTLTGAAAGDFFGISVSSAGDVNGDGYGDVIVGAYANDAGGSNAGRAYIYFGGASIDNTPEVTLTGAAAGDVFGVSVSSAGDVNGDGYSDVIVGAYANDAGGTDAGRAYIYFGGVSMDDTPEVTLTGTAAGDLFGISVSNAGDVNGDGYSDVIVGAYTNDAGGTDAGRAYIYFGGVSIDNTPDVTLTGTAAGDYFGYSVSSAGDVNGDGYSDVIVGAYYNDAGGTDAGRAYFYCNSLTGSDIADEFFTGAAAGDYFGTSVASAGDVNGDGYTDVIVGANGNDAGGTDAGRAYIFFGRASMDNTPDVTLTGAAADDLFGNSVSSAGDVNGDGYADVIVGAYFNDAGGTNAGRAYIFFGGASMDNTPDVTLTGAAAYDWFGYSVSSAGDFNGDGYGDVIVGAYRNDESGTDAGRAYIYFGGVSIDNTPDVTLSDFVAGDWFGCSVSSAGDVNGDGYGDVIVGAIHSTDAGRAYIYFGGASMYDFPDVTFTGAAANDRFGESVSSAGDVNGDGYSDVIVGALFNNAGGIIDAGSAYIYFGGASMDNTVDVTLTGVAEQNYFGNSVSSAGDVNGDGYSDVIVGAYGNNAGGIGAGTGSAYIYFGGVTIDTTPDVTLTGTEVQGGFGNSVSSAGDVNGDGYSDVIVGAYANSAGGLNAGRAYIYKSSSPPIVPRIARVGDVPFDQGGSVNIRWIRSGYDAKGINRITEYLLQRSNPPGVGAYAWQTIATISATHEPQYAYVAETPNDSMTNNSGTYFFRVTARTANPDEYWRSNIISGHSVDNISPSAPAGFRLSPLGSGPMELTWSLNRTDPDVRGYCAYRSTSSGFPVGPSTLVLSTTDTVAVDTTVAPGITYYYRVTAIDIHGNESLSSDEKSQVTVEIENGGTNVIPKVFALLQNYPNPFNPVTTIEFMLADDGWVTLKVYDMLGREVETLVNAGLKAGILHRAMFDASKLSTGMYLYRLQSGNSVQVKKLMILK